MIVRVALFALLVFGVSLPTWGQRPQSQNTIKQWEWAVSMFENNGGTLRHDFGTVARGAKADYHFKLTNIFQEDCHIAGVKSSCGCTSPQIKKADLKTWETGEIIAELNTLSPPGDKSATITVSFDKPYPAEVYLNVQAKIRADVVVEPGEVSFGAVDIGKGAEKKITVTYAGRETWSLKSIDSSSHNLEATIAERSCAEGRVVYDVIVKLKKEAPAGVLNDQIFLVTNDKATNNLPIDVEGNITADISVSQDVVFFGVVHPGDKKTMKLVVRGKHGKVFRITDIKCDDESFEFDPPTRSNNTQVVPIVFTAGDKPGKVTRTIVIETDQGAQAEVTAYAQVVGEGAPKAAQSAKKKAPKPKIGPADDDEEEVRR